MGDEGMGIFFGRNKKTEETQSTTVAAKVEEPCERWRNDNVKSSTIASHLLSTFGTTDLNRVAELFLSEKNREKLKDFVK